MTPYLSIYLFSIIFSLTFSKSFFFKNINLWILLSILIIFVGTRYQIGGDWNRYNEIYEIYKNQLNNSIYTSIRTIEIFYILINYISISFDGDVLLVNLIIASIFIFCLFYFIKDHYLPSLSLAILLPYLVFIIGMGFVRQSLSIGFIMLAVCSLSAKKNNSYFLFLFYLLCATMAHKYAAMFFIFLPFINNKINIYNLNIILILVMLFFIILIKYLYPYALIIETLKNYTLGYYHSKGAYYRFVLNIIPCLMFLLFYPKFINDNRLNFFTATIFINITFILFIFNYSTIIDRISYYFIPMQALFYSLILEKIDNNYLKYSIIISIYILYLLTFLFWFTYADHLQFWVPYSSFIFL